jgi:hypothetical protein
VGVASNYEAICRENRESYGTKGATKAGELAGNLYDDRTHFIFELLQNAEDALRRRGEWNGSRQVSFTLSPTSLTLSHFGKPFDEADVRSVCDIAESTKNEASIGRFGLGFKSVYTVTDLPEIHSGDEDFAIEDYVFPRAIQRSARAADETQIVLPLKKNDATVWSEISAGFRQLGPRALLFLRHIDAITWRVEGGATGFYQRNRPDSLGPNVQRVTLTGTEDGSAAVEQSWLVFHREVSSSTAKNIGRVEIAFSLVAAKDAPGQWTVQPLAKSPLVVFFPTIIESHLGFLVQGPYRTTPSRDNVPAGDPWNQQLIVETSDLLVEAMRWLRDHQMLQVAALRCLPLNREKFPKETRFAPMFEAVRQAFLREALLPTFDDRFVTVHQAKLSRTQELRELISPPQLAALFGAEVSGWLSADITQDKAPEIRNYLMNELRMEEFTPIKLVPSLTKAFLEQQSDAWVLRLYEFLAGQEHALRRFLDTVPLIRLEDGRHVVALEGGKPAAFLPGDLPTGFPTMRRAVCATPQVRLFLNALGITEPDPVDDVIRNLLPKYQRQEVDVEDDDYAADIDRILKAFKSDSSTQREKLRAVLLDTTFVMVVDAGDRESYVSKPVAVYLATDRLEQLFAGVPEVMMVDNRFDCLRGEEIRELLVACGASRTLLLETVVSTLGADDLARMRRAAGLERARWENPPQDVTVRGLAGLLALLPTLSPEDAAVRARVLWEALAELASRNEGAFAGSYQWGFGSQTRSVPFDAQFVEMLLQASWVPNTHGELVTPRLVVFETLGWKPHPFLQSKIVFKAPKVDQLAQEAGIDPAVIALLMRDPTAGAELLRRAAKAAALLLAPARVSDERNSREASNGGGKAQAVAVPVPEKTRADQRGDNPSGADSQGDEPDTSDASGDKPVIYKMVRSEPENDTSADDAPDGAAHAGGDRTGKGAATSTDGGDSHAGSGMPRASAAKGGGDAGRQGYRSPGSVGGRPFVSYVGTHPDDEGHDPDGVDQMERMRIEACAIDLILSLEPTLQRTPEGNPGFDLFEADSGGRPVRWVEVKAMTGTLKDRPVGLSHTQFDLAREKREAYWLYVVEQAIDPARGRVLRIQNPAGFAKTFTFDHGWLAVAKTEPPG